MSVSVDLGSTEKIQADIFGNAPPLQAKRLTSSRFRRLTTIPIPPSRRLAKSVASKMRHVFVAVSISGLLSIAFGVLQFVLHNIGIGLFAMLFGVLEICFGGAVAVDLIRIDINLLLYSTIFALTGQALLLVFTSIDYFTIRKAEFPKGCVNVPTAAKPDSISVDCAQFIDVSGSALVVLACALVGYLSSILLILRLKAALLRLANLAQATTASLEGRAARYVTSDGASGAPDITKGLDSGSAAAAGPRGSRSLNKKPMGASPIMDIYRSFSRADTATPPSSSSQKHREGLPVRASDTGGESQPGQHQRVISEAADGLELQTFKTLTEEVSPERSSFALAAKGVPSVEMYHLDEFREET